MVAGLYGPAPGSASGAGLDDNDGSVLLHAPRKIVSADAIARLATVRALHDQIIATPPSNLGRSRHAANRKTPVGAMMSIKLRRGSDLVSVAPSYIGLKKALTPLFA